MVKVQTLFSVQSGYFYETRHLKKTVLPSVAVWYLITHRTINIMMEESHQLLYVAAQKAKVLRESVLILCG